MYGVAGERRLDEYVVPWLPGYERLEPGQDRQRRGQAAPTRCLRRGAGHLLRRPARRARDQEQTWDLECALVDHLETIWRDPDEGIWEVRGGRRHFTHSKVMAWVAFDRAVRSIEEFGLAGPVERWRQVRAEIHASVASTGSIPAQNAFVQSYGATALDASLLLIPLVGFLPPDDPRVHGTIAAIERKLIRNGLVLRYDTGRRRPTDCRRARARFSPAASGSPTIYALTGRTDEARALFERLLALCNDVGLLAEEYDPVGKRQLGNFPQAFSHLALINTAHNLANVDGPANTRANRSTEPG